MSQWISVDEDLPKLYYHGVYVWIVGDEDDKPGTYSIGYINEGEEWYEWMTDRPMSEFGYKVVAWQELPDEYKEER